MDNKIYDFEIKANKQGVISGYASVFNTIDEDNDIIKYGAFNNLDVKNVKLLWQHNTEYPIGKLLSLKQDDYGLAFSAQLLLKISKAKEAYELIKENIISGISIGYSVADSYYEKQKNIRVITKLNLFEISLVTFPANRLAVINNVKSKINNNDMNIVINNIDNCIKILNEN